MTKKPPAPGDPLIDEVRERRRALLADFGDDLEAFCQAIRERQQEHPDRLVDRRRPRREEAGRQ